MLRRAVVPLYVTYNMIVAQPCLSCGAQQKNLVLVFMQEYQCLRYQVRPPIYDIVRKKGVIVSNLLVFLVYRQCTA